MKRLEFNNLEFYQSVFELIDSNMYILISGERLLIVDPHYSKDFSNFLKKKTIKEITVLLTHEHPDHTSGIPWLKEKYPLILICSKYCDESIRDAKNNRPTLISFILAEQDKIEKTSKRELIPKYFKSYSCEADIIFEKSFEYLWEDNLIKFYHTPGHSKGSISIILNNKFIFTGDSLLKDLPVITRFPGGSLEQYNEITLPFYKSQDMSLIVFPGHGDSFPLYGKTLNKLV